MRNIKRTMIVAISTHADHQHVERFGHDFPVVLVNMDQPAAARTTERLAPQGGCCRSLAERIQGADVLICTGLGQGAARHLKDFGVAVAVVAEGITVSAALAALANQNLETANAEPTACSNHAGGHHTEQGCGCGGDD